MKNNIDKKIDNTPTVKDAVLMASETAAEEKRLSDFGDMEYGNALKEFLKNNPDKTEEDFISAIRRLNLKAGGTVIKLSDYRDPASKIRKLDLASHFTPGKTLDSLSEKEKDALNVLLKLTFGKKD